MVLKRLSWRIGLPFAGFVLAGSVALIIGMGWHLNREDEARFEKLARTNAEFINRVRLPASHRMAQELTEVLGVSVFFRHAGELIPEPQEPLRHSILNDLPSDRRCHYSGGLEGVAVRLASGDDLVFARFAFDSWARVWNSETAAVLGGFWFLALLVAWLVIRGLVRPLRLLAAQLPEIEKPGPLELSAASRPDEIGDLARAFLRTRDALQKERSHREQVEKLAVLGRMTAALAHEIQNPVAAIKMHAQLWQDDPDSPAGTIFDEAGRIESLVSQWMFLSRPESPALADVAVGDLLRNSLAAHQAQMTYARVEATMEAPPDLIMRGDRRRMQQVLSNLITNAIQAMPMGGRLTLRAARTATGGEIAVEDSGLGFSSEALHRFAEFFFSEKEGGMGIGLSVADEIVKAHGGTVLAENRPEGGAKVTISFPVEK